MTDATLTALKATIKKAEGYRDKLYLDTVGVQTIGYGRAIGRVGISQDEAELMFANDIGRAIGGLDITLPWWRELDEVRQSALVEMVFQLGANTFMDFRKMRTALFHRDYETAADEILNSRWHVQTPRRCERIAKMIRTGQAL